MRQIVYFSTAAERQDEASIDEILATSRRRNLLDGVTGLLMAGGNRYLQILEGSPAAIGQTLARIQLDRRHLGLSVLVDRNLVSRNFSEWKMAFCREPRLDEFASFSVLAAQMHDAVDPRLRDQIRRMSEKFATSPMQLAATPWRSSDTMH